MGEEREAAFRLPPPSAHLQHNLGQMLPTTSNTANGNGINGTSSNNSSTDSSYFARIAASNASAMSASRSSPVPAIAMSRPQGFLDVDTPLDDKSALAQILGGIAEMQREVCTIRRGVLCSPQY